MMKLLALQTKGKQYASFTLPFARLWTECPIAFLEAFWMDTDRMAKLQGEGKIGWIIALKGLWSTVQSLTGIQLQVAPLRAQYKDWYY